MPEYSVSCASNQRPAKSLGLKILRQLVAALGFIFRFPLNSMIPIDRRVGIKEGLLISKNKPKRVTRNKEPTESDSFEPYTLIGHLRGAHDRCTPASSDPRRPWPVTGCSSRRERTNQQPPAQRLARAPQRRTATARPSQLDRSG